MFIESAEEFRATLTAHVTAAADGLQTLQELEAKEDFDLVTDKPRWVSALNAINMARVELASAAQALHEKLNEGDEMLRDLEQEAQPKIQPQRTPFQVALFRTDGDSEPFSTLTITAKMPLGALAFALPKAGVKQAGRVEVTWGDEAEVFYHVAIKGTQLKYDRAVISEESTEGQQ